MWPLQLPIYKGVTGKFGAVKFNAQAPHFYVKKNNRLKNFDGRFIKDDWKKQDPGLTESDLVAREGAVFMEITSTKDKNVYDWDRKIVFAFNLWDVGKALQVLEGQKQEVKLMHDPHAGSADKGKIQKYVTISSPKGLTEGILINASQRTSGGENVNHMVPLSGHEVIILRECFKSFVPFALSWN
jgi:hypothetical protein